jgi:origin recognition complex subunit 5
VLNAVGVSHAIIRSQECITVRHLLERTIAACGNVISHTSRDDNEGVGGRCENTSALAHQLQLLLKGTTEQLVLVFDGVDRQREATPTLLPALARLGESVRGPLMSDSWMRAPSVRLTDCYGTKRYQISVSFL